MIEAEREQLELALTQSDALHKRVRAFASRWANGSVTRWHTDEQQAASHAREFEALALELVAFQSGADHPHIDSLLQAAVPADCFRFGRLFRFPIEHAQLSFVTSGTTGSASGTHYMRVRETYEHLSLLGGQHGLGLKPEAECPPIVLALAPWTGKHTNSSLGYMMQRFMERFDGRSLCARRETKNFRLEHPHRWLASEQGIDVGSLRNSIELAHGIGARVVLLATSFALVKLLDELADESCLLPPGSVVMQTGGFKGRSRALAPSDMQQELYRAFGPTEVVGEYGMTELSSQLYERPPSADQTPAQGLYYEPPWLKVVVCDPVSLRPLPDGETGVACFVDLGNVDSTAVVLTQDCVRREAGGVRLLGRLQGAPLRGCSLGIEALFVSPGRQPFVSPGRPPFVSPSSPAHQAPKVSMKEDERLVRARARVERLLSVTRRLARSLKSPDEGGVASGADRRVEALAVSSGLSPAGVRLALDLSLELEPSPVDITRVLSAFDSARVSGPPSDEPTVWVVLSATVFTAAHRALALALAVSADVRVRPSSRSPEFVRYLQACDPTLFQVVDAIAPGPGDQVFAYGSDETLSRLRASLQQGVTLYGHGHGIGVALLGPGANAREAALALAQDIVLFDQQGCLSPRLVLVHPSVDLDHFRQALVEHLNRWERQVPRGELSPDALRTAVWSERVARTLARTWSAGKGWVADYGDALSQAGSVPLAPACRAISIARAPDAELALAPIEPLVTCIGYAGEASYGSRIESAFPQARHATLGHMQRPPLDGPVDRRRLWYSGLLPH